MLRAIYSAVSARKSLEDSMQLMVNNLANTQTIGYKRLQNVSKPFKDMLLELETGNTIPMGVGVSIDEAYIDLTAGPLRYTGNTFDLGLGGQGFFTIQKKETNDIDVTRNGRFNLNKDRQLVNSNGDLVLDINNQPIQFSEQVSPDKVIFKENGDVYEGNNKLTTLKIQLVKQDNTQLPDNLKKLIAHITGTGEQDTDPKLKQGFVEQSNVSVVREMVNFITAAKAHERTQKVISTCDKILDKSINEMGRVS